MAKNELLPFANGENANVLPTQQWEALTDILENGFQSGVARSEQVNRVLAQGAVASYVLGQLIVDQLNKDATLDKDTLYQNIVKALQENAKDVCLPLNGGTLKGGLWLDDFIRSTGVRTFWDIGGGSSNTTGGQLTLYSLKDNSYPGGWALSSTDGTDIHRLISYGDGRLELDGHSVDRVISISDNHIRFESGLQICWGTVTTQSNNIATVTFNMPFSHNPFVTALVSGDNDIVYSPMLRTCTPSVITLLANNPTGNRPGVGIDWMAIGKWK